MKKCCDISLETYRWMILPFLVMFRSRQDLVKALPGLIFILLNIVIPEIYKFRGKVQVPLIDDPSVKMNFSTRLRIIFIPLCLNINSTRYNTVPVVYYVYLCLKLLPTSILMERLYSG